MNDTPTPPPFTESLDEQRAKMTERIATRMLELDTAATAPADAARDLAEEALDAIEANSWELYPVGSLIHREDIRDGDVVRAEYDGITLITTAEGLNRLSIAFTPAHARFWLIERPAPEIPTEPGAVLVVDITGYGTESGRDCHFVTLGRDGTWRGAPVVCKSDALREKIASGAWKLERVHA